jgi:PhzF family phenazine biosynthesis protein
MSFIFVTLPDLATLALAHTHGHLNVNTYDPSSLDEGWQVGLVCTMYLVAQGTDEHGRKAYRTRMFGTREDPGTGSASSALACWLALQESDGEEEKTTFGFSFTQGVEMGKRNDISVEVVKGKVGEIEMVKLSGPTVQVMEGSLEID